jgi:uncharacterized protein YlxW (UPF0749 family)
MSDGKDKGEGERHDGSGAGGGEERGAGGRGHGHRPRGPGELPPEQPVSREDSEGSGTSKGKGSPGGKRPADSAAAHEPVRGRPEGHSEVERPAEEGESGDSAVPDPGRGRTGRQRLAQAIWPPRATRAQFIVALLLFVLGLGLAIQVRSTSENSALRGARQEDLVRILDELDGRSKRLEDEKQSLQNQRTELENSSDQAREARKQTRQKERQLGVLAGTVGAQGPGIELTVNDSRGSVRADMLLDTVQELRAAGAEAIQVNGVRVVASTYFSDSGRAVRVDGRKISQPYRFEVIGKPQDLEPALNIPGGVVQTLRKEQAQVSVSRSDRMIVSALRSAKSPHYARSSSQ